MEMLKKWRNNMLARCKSTKGKNNSKCNSHHSWCKASSSSPSQSSSPSSPSSPSPSPPPSSSNRKAKRMVAPRGCFSVYVGSERQRFVIKAKNANHPLFMMLLEDAQQEYGYSREGPILLPCEVDFFCKVLAEMDSNVAAIHIIPSPFLLTLSHNQIIS